MDRALGVELRRLGANNVPLVEGPVIEASTPAAPKATCRDAVLDVVGRIVAARPSAEFTLSEVLEAMARQGSPFKPETIVRVVRKRMTGVPAPEETRRSYVDLIEVATDRYKLA